MHTNRIITLPKLIKTPKRDQINQKDPQDARKTDGSQNEILSWQEIRQFKNKSQSENDQ